MRKKDVFITRMDMKKCNNKWQQIHCLKIFLNWNKSLIDYENITLTIALSENVQRLGSIKDEYLWKL
jgi:hypothetical protein